MSKRWRLLDYVNSIETNFVQKWFQGLSIQEQTDLIVLLRMLQAKRQWGMPEYRTLKGYKQLGEIRWDGDNRKQLRLIGSPGNGTFTFLTGCSHKERVYDPPNALDTAAKRQKDLDNDRGTTCETTILQSDEEADEG